MPEVSMIGDYMGELVVQEVPNYQVFSENYMHFIPVDRTLEVNEVFGGE